MMRCVETDKVFRFRFLSRENPVKEIDFDFGQMTITRFDDLVKRYHKTELTLIVEFEIFAFMAWKEML